MGHRSTRVSRSDRGAAAVEFAVVSTLILIPLLLGIIEFGFVFQAQITLTNAAREGARMAAVGKYVQSTVENRAEPVTPVTIKAYVDGVLVDDPNTATRGQEIRIDMTHDWHWVLLPLPESTWPTLHGAVTMRKE